MAIQKIKLDLGTVYQKEEGGIYYFRYQVNGARKAISLKTRNQKEALKEANKQIPLLKATSAEIIAAHIKHARGLITPEKNLLLSEAWAVYERSPERATPDTVSEALAYRSTFEEFVNWINDPGKTLRDITSQIHIVPNVDHVLRFQFQFIKCRHEKSRCGLAESIITRNHLDRKIARQVKTPQFSFRPNLLSVGDCRKRVFLL